MTQPHDLLTVEEAAAKLKLSKASIYRLAKQKRLTYLRVGSLLRFRPSDLDDFLAGREVQAVER